MIKMHTSAIIEFLNKNNYRAELQPDTGQVYLILKITGQEFPLFVRLFDEGHLLQFIAFIPCQMKSEFLPDVARLLHMLNKELDMPGFGIDESANAIFYRIVLPISHKEVPEELFKLIVMTIERICGLFGNAIASVALGFTKLEEVIKKSKETSKKS